MGKMDISYILDPLLEKLAYDSLNAPIQGFAKTLNLILNY
jgi:hypothetical protein